jgi:hypothetical protein
MAQEGAWLARSEAPIATLKPCSALQAHRESSLGIRIHNATDPDIKVSYKKTEKRGNEYTQKDR